MWCALYILHTLKKCNCSQVHVTLNVCGIRPATSCQQAVFDGIAAGGTSKRAVEIFRQHDLDSDGFLDRHEMLVALSDLGVLKGVAARRVGAYCRIGVENVCIKAAVPMRLPARRCLTD
jgi:hypothetical protein